MTRYRSVFAARIVNSPRSGVDRLLVPGSLSSTARHRQRTVVVVIVFATSHRASLAANNASHLARFCFSARCVKAAPHHRYYHIICDAMPCDAIHCGAVRPPRNSCGVSSSHTHQQSATAAAQVALPTPHLTSFASCHSIIAARLTAPIMISIKCVPLPFIHICFSTNASNPEPACYTACDAHDVSYLYRTVTSWLT